MSYRIDLVVPVYNEVKNFQRLYDYVSRNVRSDWQLLIVYDFPEDSTLTTAKPISEKDRRVKLVFNPVKGVLGAIRAGFAEAKADAILVVMADESSQMLSQIDALTNTFYLNNATIVVASRYMKGGSHTGGAFIKSTLSRLAGISLYWLIRLPTHDATNNTRLYRKAFLDRTVIESKRGFELALELTLKAHLAGEIIKEIPVSWTERTEGTSRFQLLGWLPAYLYWYWYGIRKYYFSKKQNSD